MIGDLMAESKEERKLREALEREAQRLEKEKKNYTDGEALAEIQRRTRGK